METPHIEFTWSSDALATILDTLEVQGLGSGNKTTGLYSTWPQQEQWTLYTSKLMQWMPTLLSDEERDTLENKLSTVESAFNTYLSQPNTGNEKQQATELSELLKQLEEIEALICDRGSHAAYPYFARWFTLNVAVLKVFMNYENRLAQVKGVKVWWRGRKYLEQVFHSACAARASQVTTSVTGAFMDRVYVRDERTGTPLTIDVKMGTEDENAILNIQQFLRHTAGWQYIQDISLEESVKILEQVRNALTVTTESQTKQDQVLDASQFWHDKQKFIEYEIEEQRKACEPAFDRLINHEVRKASLSNVKAGAKLFNSQHLDEQLVVVPQQLAELRAAQQQAAPRQAALQAFIEAYKPLVVPQNLPPIEKAEAEREFVSAIEIVNRVVPNLLGMIPIIGDVSGMIFGTFLAFFGGSQPDPWLAFEDKMKRMVRDQISIYDENTIRNKLTGYDDSIQLFLREYSQELESAQGITPIKLAGFKDRIGRMLDSMIVFQPQITTPASNRYLRIAPYYEHYFLTHLFLIAIGEKLEIPTYDFPERRKKLYRDTNLFVLNAINQIAQERHDDIQLVTEQLCAGGQSTKIYDHFKNVTFNTAVDTRDTHRIGTYRKAAGLIASTQLIRELCMRVDGIIQKDTSIGPSFNKLMVRETYNSKMRHYQSSIIDHFFYLEQEAKPTGYDWPRTVHQDARTLHSYGINGFHDFKKPPRTVFDIIST